MIPWRNRGPTTIKTSNGEMQTHEEAIVPVKDIILTIMSARTRQQFYRSESFPMKKDFLTNASTVRNHISFKRDSDTVRHGELRSDRGSRLFNEFFLQFVSFNYNDIFITGDSFYIFLKPVFFTNYGSIKRQWDSRKRGSKWNWFSSSGCVKFKCWREM